MGRGPVGNSIWHVAAREKVNPQNSVFTKKDVSSFFVPSRPRAFSQAAKRDVKIKDRAREAAKDVSEWQYHPVVRCRLKRDPEGGGEATWHDMTYGTGKLTRVRTC